MARLIIVDDNQELATLIASSARSRGHVSRTVFTGKGALAALATGTFDCAVIDLLLPDMRGSEVLTQLKAHGVPAIAISGVYKGERFAKEATLVHGARAYFEKPFDLTALLASVENVTGPAEVAAPAASPEEDPLDELQAVDPIQEPEPAEAAPASAATPEPFDAPVPAVSEGADDLANLLPLSEWERIWKRQRDVVPAPRRQVPEWATAGHLTAGSVPRLLNAYYQARHDGELRLKQGMVVKLVAFEAGRPVYAASNLAHERFARFCGRKGLLPESELVAVSALAKEEGLRTGDAMVRLDLITPDKRRALLEEQVKEIIWSTFSWTEGDYAFSAHRPARPDMIRLSVFPGELIFEGVQRAETLVSLRLRMAPARRLVPSADPPYALHEFKLTGPQAQLIAHADGTKSVEDLLSLTDLSERDALAALVAFELLGLVEERREDGKRRRISFGL
jgi:CheY-like chemotaxis protein